MSAETRLTGRTDLWKQCLAIAGNPLVGTGFESFWLGWRIQRIWDENVGIRLNEAHNGYLELYLQLGWCGVALLAVGLARGYPKLFVASDRISRWEASSWRIWLSH